jgi:diguanylate cyclase (GGDEF)-like protein
LLAAPAVAQEADGARDRLVYAGENGYGPYETIDEDGRAVGFNIDLIEAVAAAQDFELEFDLGEWAPRRRALRTGEVDIMAMFVSQRREREFDFSEPYLIVHHRIFTPADAPRIQRIDELAGKRVIVQRAALSHDFLEQLDIDMELTLVRNDSEGIKLLAAGEHDAALLTENRSRRTLADAELDALAISGPPVLPVEYAFAVDEGREELLASINAGLERVRGSGEFDRIYRRWLQPYATPRAEDRQRPATTRLAWGGFLLALLLLVGLLARKLWLSRRKMKAAYRELHYLKRHDALTGLLSRHALERRLDELLERFPGQTHSLLHIDVDQFRLVNETAGRAVADAVLRQLAGVLGNALPESASVARIGGDEFVALLPHCGLENAVARGRQLLEALDNGDQVLPALPDRHRLTLSIGVVGFTGEEETKEVILRRADCACVAAKEDGRARVHPWQPGDRRLAERYGELRWVSRIQDALRDERIVLYFQPIVAAGHPSRLAGAEILVRMLPEQAGQEAIRAGAFMPAAERYFLTPRIDRFVFEKVFEWIEANAATFDRIERINVNVSGRSLGDAGFLAYLDRRARTDRRTLSRLCLEVTETALISNLDRARRILDRLHEAGCRIALDDFGTGVSSMNYLRQLPVDVLKFDGTFVAGIDSDPGAREFIREMNRLGKAMGKTTVAECVETEAVRAVLAEDGIDLIQGYVIAHPAPLDEIGQWLDSSDAP